MRHGRIVSGGSTVTQQLIKICEPRPRTFRTKIMEKSSILSLLLEEGAGTSKRDLDEARSTGKLPGLIKS